MEVQYIVPAEESPCTDTLYMHTKGAGGRVPFIGCKCEVSKYLTQLFIIPNTCIYIFPLDLFSNNGARKEDKLKIHTAWKRKQGIQKRQNRLNK